MRTSTVKEYKKELQDFFNALEEVNPDVLEGLGVTGDLDGFIMELTMIGMRTLQKNIHPQ